MNKNNNNRVKMPKIKAKKNKMKKNNNKKNSNNKYNKQIDVGDITRYAVGTQNVGNVGAELARMTRLRGNAGERFDTLSPCCAKYAAAICNPWSPDANGACVPYGTNRLTQKATGFLRFDATVGSGGFGFVLISPTIANDAVFAWYSNGAFPGTSATFALSGADATTDPGVQAAFMSNLPYNRSNVGTPIVANSNASFNANRGRIVSVGVSASYTGTTLNQSGLTYCYTDPQHANQHGAGAVTLGGRAETDVANVQRAKCWLMASAIDFDELEFSPASTNPSEALGLLYPFSRNAFITTAAATNTYYNGAAPMVIAFTGVPGNVMHIEIVQHTEYIGAQTEGRATPNTMDTQGVTKVLDAANRVPALKVSSPGRRYGDLFYEALKYAGQELVPVAVKALKMMLI